MSAKFILQQRLMNQQLSVNQFKEPAELVRWMIAMQAQEFAMAKWAIGLRIPGTTETDIDKALDEGAILRTHLMRPTWHFVGPEDIRWLLALTAPRINALSASMFKKLELDNPLFNRTNKILTKALENGKALTRVEINSILREKKIIADGLRLIYIIIRAEIDGIICSGPRRGKQATYCLLEERVKPMPKISRSEALQLFTERYFLSRGPATLKDFATWSGLAMQDVREGAGNLPGQFERFSWKEEEYIFKPNHYHGKFSSTGNFLMPIYDEYGMGYKDRSHLFDKHLNPVGPTIFNNLIVINGAAAGGWVRTFEGKKLKLQTYPFTTLNKSNQGKLDKSIKLFRKFYGA